MSAPTGSVPHTTNRIVAFIRPNMRSGVIVWRRLTWFTLYITSLAPPTKPIRMNTTVASDVVTRG